MAIYKHSPRIALVIILCLLQAVPAFHAPGKSEAAQLRGLNGVLLKLASELRRADPDQTAELTDRLSALASQRLALLQTLMEQLPEEALSLAFPPDVVQELQQVAGESAMEQHGEWEGTLEYLIADNKSMTEHQSIRRLHTADGVLELHLVDGPQWAALKSGDTMRVRGIRAGESVAAADGSTVTSTSTATAAAAPACGPIGAQKVVAILVNFGNYSLPSSVTPDAVKGFLFGNAHSSSQSSPDWSVDDFWQQGSDGQTWIDVPNSVVVGPYSLSQDFNNDTTGDGKYDCQNTGIRDAAIAAADADVNFQNFGRVLIVMPDNRKANPDGTTGGCTWAGLGNLGCYSYSSAGDGAFTASIAWEAADSLTNRSDGVKLTTHELGHNLTLGHARSRDFGSDAIGALGAAGTRTEYGDLFSTMGSWNFGLYSAHHAAQQLGWLQPSSNYLQVESNGTFTLQDYERRPAGLKALKIRRGTGNDAWLWVEARKNSGIYDSQLNSQVWSGALIHYQDSTTGAYTDLADFTTNTSSMSDPALAAGQSWTDPYSDVHLSVDAATGDSLTVSVSYGSVPCSPANPTVTLSPVSTSTNYGATKSFTLTVQNNDSGSCAPDTFSLSSVMPDPSWSAALQTDSLQVAPGQQGQTTLNVTVPDPYALGTYLVSAKGSHASDAAYLGTGSTNVTVVDPTYKLTGTVAARGSVKINPPNTSCRGTCTQVYPSSAGAQVTLTATPDRGYTFTGWSGACSGTQTTCAVSMTGDRSFSATFAKTTKGGR